MKRKLSCKELADALGRHPNYVYLMRQCGFAMEWERGVFVASEDQARAWIARRRFRVVHGTAVVVR